MRRTKSPKAGLFRAICFLVLLLPAGASAADAARQSSSFAPTASVTNAPPARARPPGGESPTECPFADRAREKTYRILQREVERLDSLFARESEEQQTVPPSLFQLGLLGEVTFGPREELSFDPIVDADVEIRLPTAEKRIRLLITTRDPTALPEEEVLERRRPLRLAVARNWLRQFDSGIGIRVRVPPVLYAKTSWAKTWPLAGWRFHPYEKIFWESDKGLGEVTSLVAAHWKDPWDFRAATSVKWSLKKMEDDRETSTGEGGWEWEQSFMLIWAHAWIFGKETGHLAGEQNLAHGSGVRLSFAGSFRKNETTRVSFVYKAPLYKRWTFWVATPAVEWNRQDNWATIWSVRLGIELLLCKEALP